VKSLKIASRLFLLVVAVEVSTFGLSQSSPAQATNRNATTSEEIHVLVGHSMVLRTEARLKRVLVGNPAVLTTSTTSPNEVVVTPIAPGASSVLMWQEDDKLRDVQIFADIDVTNLRGALKRSLPKEDVGVEGSEDKVVLTGTVSSQATADQVAKMASQFGKSTVNSLQIALPSRHKEVLLKVRFVEVDRGRLQSYGFNLLSTGAGNTIGSTTTGQFGGVGLGTQGAVPTSTLNVSNLLNIFLFRSDLNLGATISDLQQKNILQILAEPNLMSVSGSPAKFLAGGELPYPVVTGGAAGSLGTVTVQFKPYGVKLEFTGEVEDDGIIRLTVAPEVSSLDYGNAVTVSGFVLPAISTRRAETVVELKSGQSFGIAGLLDQRTTAQLSKMPGIADIPVLGLLFHSKSVNRQSTELMVFVTPELVDPLSSQPPLPPTPPMPYENMSAKQYDENLHKKGDN
jgi:pilus assembly protein CpaC